MITPQPIAPQVWRRADGYELSTERERIDVDAVEQFLAQHAYWTKGLPRPVLERALAASLPFGIHAPDGTMAGFGRLVTDFAVFAYLRDMFVQPAHRGRGLASWVAATIRTHPELSTVTTWMLSTRDAHAIYARAGFAPVPNPENYMRVKMPG